MHTIALQTTARMATRALSRTDGLLRRFVRWRRERRTAIALDALDNATLKDIGICRCEIPWIARSVWNDPGIW